MPSQLVKLLREGTLAQVKTYVKKNPESVKQKDEETGRIALHDAVDSFTFEDGHQRIIGLEKITFLLDIHRMGATEMDKRGRLPLHVIAAAPTVHARRHLDALIQSFGSATGIRDSEGYLPVHSAILASKFRMAKYLIEKHVGSIDATSMQKVPPLLELALQNGATTAFIRLLLQKAPHCAEITDDMTGRLPLHSALFHTAPFDQVELILNAYGRAVELPSGKSNDSILPHHFEAFNGGRRDVLALLLDKYPQGARKPSELGHLPIHFALQNASISIESLELLNESYPAGLETVDNEGWTALHHAVACHYSEGIVSEEIAAWVLEKSPLLLRATSNNGNHPLHCASYNPKISLSVLNLLIDKFPQALRSPDHDGDLPVHCALLAEGKTSEEIVQRLLVQYPEATRRVNNDGQLPLHCACIYSLSMEIIDLLIKHNPSGLSVYDNDGYLPIHVAITMADDSSVVSHLTKKLNGGIVPSTKNGTSPLFLACEEDVPLDIVLLLVRHSLELFPGNTFPSGSAEPALACVANPPNSRKRRKMK